MFHIIKRKTTFSIKIKNIKIKIHDNFEYVFLNLFFQEKRHGEPAMTHVKKKFHLVNDLKIKMFINMNVMKSERVMLNFDNKIMIVPTCQDMEMPISFHRKNAFVEKIVRAAAQITMSTDKTMTVPIRIKSKTDISQNRNYSFYSKTERMLKSEGDYFAHVTDFNIITMQIRNIASKSYTISKNFKIKHIRNYDEKDCFLINSKNYHFAIISIKVLNIKKNISNRRKCESR